VRRSLFSHIVVEARQLVAAPRQDVDALLQKVLGLPSPILSRKWRLHSLFLHVRPKLLEWSMHDAFNAPPPWGRQLFVLQALRGAFDTFSNKNVAVISSSLHFWVVCLPFVVATNDFRCCLHFEITRPSMETINATLQISYLWYRTRLGA